MLMSGNRVILVWAASLAVLIYALTWQIPRADFNTFIGVYGAAFGIYLWLLRKHQPENTSLLLAAGFLMRIVAVLAVPVLSDDAYRFLWDGGLTISGWHPFAHTPEYFANAGLFNRYCTPELFGLLNSPKYYTVYPPVCQGVFALSAWVVGGKILTGLVVLKLFLLLCEWGSIRCLRLLKNDYAAVAYALNPLVILEVCGNAHFEGAMIFFALWALWLLQRASLNKAAVVWALSVASKLLPLMWLPLVWARLGWAKGGRFLLAFSVASLMLFSPLLQMSVLTNMAASIDLYFQKFEFNASLYYLIRALANHFAEKNTGEILGPIMGLLSLSGLLFLTWRAIKRSDISLYALLMWSSVWHLLCSTTVHPWYVLVPFAFSLLTRWRFPLVWTGVAALSYSHYAGGLFQENYGWIAVEYCAVLGWMGIDSMKRGLRGIKNADFRGFS
ncbi:MAG: hypothetical protein IT269_06530 [Saprospiraceae bacterium]|nr:hypothetical protein [Saprospiraceae bacterium]